MHCINEREKFTRNLQTNIDFQKKTFVNEYLPKHVGCFSDRINIKDGIRFCPSWNLFQATTLEKIRHQKHLTDVVITAPGNTSVGRDPK